MCNATRRFHALLILVWVFWPIPAGASPRCPQSAQTEQAHDASQPAAPGSRCAATRREESLDERRFIRLAQPSGDFDGSFQFRPRETGAECAEPEAERGVVSRPNLEITGRNFRPWTSKLRDCRPPSTASQPAMPANPFGRTAFELDSWAAELDQLNKKRADISDNITELRDEARRNGIPANALP